MVKEIGSMKYNKPIPVITTRDCFLYLRVVVHSEKNVYRKHEPPGMQIDPVKNIFHPGIRTSAGYHLPRKKIMRPGLVTCSPSLSALSGGNKQPARV
jgi:hypothetical protein